MRLNEALGVALEERYALGPRSSGREPATPITDRRGLAARMNRITARFGGNRRAAARAAGVPYSTWNHLLGARRGVSQKNLDKITNAFARFVTAPARALRVKRVGYPDEVRITAVVVAEPGPPEESPEDNRGASRYVNGHGSGVTRAETEAISGIEEDPGYRTFRAEGLDTARIVDAWLSQGSDAAAEALLDEIEDVYGTEFGFEGDHVRVEFV
jgi:hypothetical protein